MSDKLLEIQPSELKFTFELKKRCSCTVQLVNNTDHHVAFKVKATSPNRYYVRPNIDIVQPKSTCDFTVIMEAQQVAPFGMKCKDKFLIQSTVVSFGTTDEQITPGLFRKDNGRHIDESKLRVVLVTPPHSPACDNGALKVPAHEGPKLVDAVTDGVENLSPPPMFIKDLTQLEVVKLKLVNDLDDGKVAGSEEKCKLTKDVDELNSKLKKLESNLNEVEATISRLRGERNMTTNDEQTLKREFEIARTHESVKEVQVGFSFLFVCLVILISLELGYELLGSFRTGTTA